VVMPNMFAGSILDLEPDTAYDARFCPCRSDGASGQTTRIVTVRTRADPSQRPAVTSIMFIPMAGKVRSNPIPLKA